MYASKLKVSGPGALSNPDFFSSLMPFPLVFVTCGSVSFLWFPRRHPRRCRESSSPGCPRERRAPALPQASSRAADADLDDAVRGLTLGVEDDLHLHRRRGVVDDVGVTREELENGDVVPVGRVRHVARVLADALHQVARLERRLEQLQRLVVDRLGLRVAEVAVQEEVEGALVVLLGRVGHVGVVAQTTGVVGVSLGPPEGQVGGQGAGDVDSRVDLRRRRAVHVRDASRNGHPPHGDIRREHLHFIGHLLNLSAYVVTSWPLTTLSAWWPFPEESRSSGLIFSCSTKKPPP